MINANTLTQGLIDDLAEAVSTDGFAAHEADVAALADHAELLGVAATTVGAMLDRRAPEIVRSRAFGAVTVRLAALLDCSDSEASAPTSTRTAPVGDGRAPALVAS